MSDKTPIGSRWSTFQGALGGMLPALKATEVTSEIVAGLAAGGIAGVKLEPLILQDKLEEMLVF